MRSGSTEEEGHKLIFMTYSFKYVFIGDAVMQWENGT